MPMSSWGAMGQIWFWKTVRWKYLLRCLKAFLISRAWCFVFDIFASQINVLIKVLKVKCFPEVLLTVKKSENWNYSKNLLLNKTLSISEPFSISVSALSSFNKTPTHAHGATISPTKRIPPQMRNILLSVTLTRILNMDENFNGENWLNRCWWQVDFGDLILMTIFLC